MVLCGFVIDRNMACRRDVSTLTGATQKVQSSFMSKRHRISTDRFDCFFGFFMMTKSTRREQAVSYIPVVDAGACLPKSSFITQGNPKEPAVEVAGA